MTAPAATDAEIARAVTVLLEMYKENTNHGRHLETQRQLVTGFILTVAAAILGALATLKFSVAACVSLGTVLIVFGLIGAFFSVVQYGKYRQSKGRWGAARTLLQKLCPAAELETVIEASHAPDNSSASVEAKNSDKKGPSAWLTIGDFPLHWLWTMLMVVVVVLGALIVFNAASLYAWAR